MLRIVCLTTSLVMMLGLPPLACADGPTALQLQTLLAAGSQPSATSIDTTARSSAAAAQSLALGALQAQGGDASSTIYRASGSTIPRTLAARFSDHVNVADFGAKSDLAYLVGPFAMAAGSSVLYTNAYRFGGSSVGQTIIIPGAGPNGTALVSQIVSIEPNGKTNVTIRGTAVTGIGDVSSAASIGNSPQTTVETGTDNTVAINAAIAYAESKNTNSASALLYSSSIFFPAGEYLVTSINLTGIQWFGFDISGQGSHLHGFGAGNIVVDALASMFIHWHDVEIDGDLFSPPKIGLQVGRNGTTTTSSAGGFSFENLSTAGNFSLAAVLNNNAETSLWISPRIENSSAGAYAYIADGVNHFNVGSKFISVNAPVDSGQSFDENLFLNPVFGTSGVGSIPLWISDAHRMRVLSGYVSNIETSSKVRSAIELYKANGTSLDQLDLDVHCESSITNVFTISGAPGSTAFDMEGFRYRENGAFSSGSIFAIDPASSINSVTLGNTDIDINQIVVSGSALFDNPTSYKLSGRLYVPANLQNLPLAGNFSGILCVGLTCDTSTQIVIPDGGSTAQSISHFAAVASNALPQSGGAVAGNLSVSGAVQASTLVVSGSQPASLVLASPTSTAGPPTFRSLAATDIANVVRSRSGAYTMQALDCGTTIRDTSQSAHTYTIPAGLPIGCKVSVLQAAGGTVTFAGAAGLTLEQAGSGAMSHTTAAVYAKADITIDSATTFLLAGQVQ